MLNFQVVIFGVILAVVGVGVDYHNQSVKSELEIGELSASAYFATITGRFAHVQAEKAAKIVEKERKSRVRAGARPYLAEAPEGWTRRELSAGDNSRISPPKRELSEHERELLAGNTMLANMAAASEKRAEEDRNNQTWVYERGDEIVLVRAQFIEIPKGNTITSNAMTMVVGNLSGMSIREGWGVIQGVAFGTYQSFAQDEKKPYRTLHASVGFGDEVTLEVRTTTTDAATREILEAIDYDGLNALLPRPLAHVGSSAKPVKPEHEVEMANRMIEIRNDLIQKRTRAAENWLKSAKNPGDAMTLAIRQIGYDVEGTMGAEDAALEKAYEDIERRSSADPADHAAAQPETGIPSEQTASSEAPSQTAGSKLLMASKPLSEDKIREYEALSAAERKFAMVGLNVAARKFEEKNGLPEGACAFSEENYRVECRQVQQAAEAEKSGGFLSMLAGVMKPKKEEEEAPAKPTRLKMSGGSSCLENALGALCKK